MQSVVGTAGHVDHGKTTLVRALTGVDTDRLPEEKRRAITIELGFAPLSLASGRRASVIDVPGHRRFVPTMIAGASGIDLVLLVVAADEGVMPQTREHANVCELLGIRRAVVALTKIDRAEDDLRALATADVDALCAGRFEYAVVPCAPREGVGVDAVRDAIDAALRDAPPREDGPPRLWIDRVMQIRGAGTVVSGTLVRGRIAKGDVVAISGRERAQVRGLHVHGARVEHAIAPTRLALNLAIDAERISRGDVVTPDADATEPTSCVDVALRGADFRRGMRVTIHVGSAMTAARVTRSDALDAAGARLLRVALDAPLAIAAGERCLVRGSHATKESGASLGGGVVLDARPLTRIAPRVRLAVATAVLARDTRAALDALVDAAAPRPLDVGRLALDAPLAAEARRAVADGRLVACGDAVIRRSTIAALASHARTRVTEHITRAPLDRGMPLASLRAELARMSSEAAADLAIRAARAPTPGAIALDGDVVVPAAHARTLPPDVEAEVARVRSMLVRAGVHGVSIGFLRDDLRMPLARARAVLDALERDASAVRAGELWFARAVVDGVRARIVDHLASARAITVIAAKELCALPRRQAILLLEHLDAAGVTRRVGDARVLAARST